MKHLLLPLVFLFVIGFFNQCKFFEREKNIVFIYPNDSNNILIADTLIYDVIIHKPQIEDTWQDLSLQNVNRHKFIDMIFQGIYKGKIIPRDHITDKPISIKEIKELEEDPDFSRDKISKIQFNEGWYIDSTNFLIKKRIQAIIFGYELYNSSGELKGYKAAFKVKY